MVENWKKAKMLVPIAALKIHINIFNWHHTI